MSSSESVSQKRPAADDVVGVTPAKLVPAPPQESALMIPEIAEHIFRFLPARQVVELRSVCARWRELIDGSSRLMSRVWIKFPSGDKLVQDYRLKFFPAGANSIAVGSNEIGYVDSWWPSVGQKLAHLKVDYFGDAVVERIIKECRVLKLLAIDGGVRLTASLLEIFQRGLASN
ncbi:hypothetical protein pipiens_012572 [Culex pipiens pipiens]|uniref:F-box domain-containing protein n=1 Tax=Culex pipiens pipiens TaxID=38569 RepID=A0ABD1D1T9_CULPP